MNLSLLSAEIARRIPEMAKDSVTNNEGVILRLMQDEQKRCAEVSVRHVRCKAGGDCHSKDCLRHGCQGD